MSTPSRARGSASFARSLLSAARSRSRRWLLFVGPALLVSVGYVDPGNWATDLEGGARFGYGLLWVLIGSSAMAVLLQSLSARLGIVSGMNLAEACRASYSIRVNVLLWALAEVGIVACDAAEVVGSAIALNLLFGVPLLLGSVLTALDVLVVLVLQHRRLAVLEACIAALLLVIAACLSGEMLLVRPSAAQLGLGLVPRLPDGALYAAIGILGATLMPHNLYLQSALVQRRPGGDRSRALRESWISTFVALNVALLLNVAILLLSAEAFGARGMVVSDLRDAHRLLAPLLGTSAASVLFATGLLCSGQSATVTGTLAGQIVMEGFLNTRLPPVVRRAVTRCAAVVPAVLVLATVGSSGMMRLLIASQVVLSMQLPFAIVPLLRLTNSQLVMGSYANRRFVRWGAALCATAVGAANAMLLWKTYLDVRELSQLGGTLFGTVCVGFALFLVWVSLVPLRAPQRSHPVRALPRTHSQAPSWARN